MGWACNTNVLVLCKYSSQSRSLHKRGALKPTTLLRDFGARHYGLDIARLPHPSASEVAWRLALHMVVIAMLYSRTCPNITNASIIRLPFGAESPQPVKMP